MKIRERRSLQFVALLFSMVLGSSAARAGDVTFRWDIVSINFKAGTVSAGGHASATANDGSKITVTGSGTFTSGEDDVTGGGTWAITTSSGTTTGTYVVTELLRFVVVSGTAPQLTDRIGRSVDARAGLAVLRVSYSDGADGILVVSCHLVGTPDSVFEGITATKGFVDFWNRQAPAAGVDANRTVFHVLAED